MSPQVFYRKWRPQTLAEVAGQEHVTQTLLQALATSRIAHAYLFSGPRGTGKTSTGRILAKAVNCLTNGHGEPCNQCAVCQATTQGNSMDVIEVDAASNRGIEEMRSLREKVAFVPGASRYKVYIIDEVHMLTEPAANALLKTLEEPPPHVIFILATTDPHKVPATILSRCQHFEFHRLAQAAVTDRLAFICQEEGITAPAEALRIIARRSTGSLRDAENTLEQVVAYYGIKLELHQVMELLGLSGNTRARELARHVLGKNLSAGLATINQANSDGLDLRQFLRIVVNYLREILLLKAGAPEAIEVTPEDLAEMKPLAGTVSLDSILRAVKLFSQIDMRLDNYSTLPLELALVECVIPPDETIPQIESAAEAARPQPVASPPFRKPVQAIAPRSSLPRAEAGPPISTPVTTPRGTPISGPEPAVLPMHRDSSIPPSRESGPSASSVSETPESAKRTRPASLRQAQDKAVPPVAPPPPDTPHFDYLRQHWREFINSLRGEGSTGTLDALLRNACEPVAIEGEAVVLGFYYPLHKEKIEDPKYCYLIERKLNQLLGGSYKIRCVLTEKKKSPSASSGQSPSASSGQSPSASSGQSPSASSGQGPEPSSRKSPGHLVEAALREGGRIINGEEK